LELVASSGLGTQYRLRCCPAPLRGACSPQNALKSGHFTALSAVLDAAPLDTAYQCLDDCTRSIQRFFPKSLCL